MDAGWPPALRALLTECWDPRADRRPAFKEVRETLKAIVRDARALKGSTARIGGNSSALLSSTARK